MDKTRWKSALSGVLLLWLLLGSAVYAFYPRVLTGWRIVDAILISAAASLLVLVLAEPLQIFYWAARYLFRKDPTPPRAKTGRPALPRPGSAPPPSTARPGRSSSA
jgi:hypothetical protein